MARNEHSVEIAGVNLGGQRHICAFFNTIDEELASFRSTKTASVRAKKLIQSGAGAGYARTKLVGHHMDWRFCGPHLYKAAAAKRV
jgi:hypothetical protein